MPVLSVDQRARGQESLSVAFEGSGVAGIWEPHRTSQENFQMPLIRQQQRCVVAHEWKGYMNGKGLKAYVCLCSND